LFYHNSQVQYVVLHTFTKANFSKVYLVLAALAHLFVKVPRPGDSEKIFSVFDSSSICYYLSNRSKVEAIPLSAQWQVNLPAYHHTISLMLIIKQKSRKYQNFKLFVLTSTKDSNTGLPITKRTLI